MNKQHEASSAQDVVYSMVPDGAQEANCENTDISAEADNARQLADMSFRGCSDRDEFFDEGNACCIGTGAGSADCEAFGGLQRTPLHELWQQEALSRKSPEEAAKRAADKERKKQFPKEPQSNGKTKA
jgi:hypothetical protein